MFNSQIMKSYETSTSTLRAILSHPSLDCGNIKKTMDAIAEANHVAQEIDNTIRVEGDIALGIEVSEEELEDEWKALIRDIEVDAEVGRKLGRLQAPDKLPDNVNTNESPAKVPVPTR
jgi:charged multivesicular body protein 7